MEVGLEEKGVGRSDRRPSLSLGKGGWWLLLTDRKEREPGTADPGQCPFHWTTLASSWRPQMGHLLLLVVGISYRLYSGHIVCVGS